MEFKEWLRTVCFKKPTKEAEDLAKAAWEAGKRPQAASDKCSAELACSATPSIDIVSKRNRETVFLGDCQLLYIPMSGRESKRFAPNIINACLRIRFGE